MLKSQSYKKYHSKLCEFNISMLLSMLMVNTMEMILLVT